MMKRLAIISLIAALYCTNLVIATTNEPELNISNITQKVNKLWLVPLAQGACLEAMGRYVRFPSPSKVFGLNPNLFCKTVGRPVIGASLIGLIYPIASQYKMVKK